MHLKFYLVKRFYLEKYFKSVQSMFKTFCEKFKKGRGMSEKVVLDWEQMKRKIVSHEWSLTIRYFTLFGYFQSFPRHLLIGQFQPAQFFHGQLSQGQPSPRQVPPWIIYPRQVPLRKIPNFLLGRLFEWYLSWVGIYRWEIVQGGSCHGASCTRGSCLGKMI